MHSQSILRPTVENSNVMCHDAWLVEGRLRNGKKERCKGSLLGQKALPRKKIHHKGPMLGVLRTTTVMTTR